MNFAGAAQQILTRPFVLSSTHSGRIEACPELCRRGSVAQQLAECK